MKKSKLIFYTVVLLSMLFLFPPPTQAYLDPGSGSYIFQLLLGTVVGGVIGFKLHWKKVVELFQAFYRKFTRK